MNSNPEKSPKLVDNKDYKKQKKLCVKSDSSDKEITSPIDLGPIAKVGLNPSNHYIQSNVCCYTSCHNTNKFLPLNKDLSKPLLLLSTTPCKASAEKNQEKSEAFSGNNLKKIKPKFVPPTVVIQPPSPECGDLSVTCSPPQSPSHSLEVSDSDSDDTLVETKLNTEQNSQQCNTKNFKLTSKIAASPVSQKLKEKLREKLTAIEKKRSSSSSDNEIENLGHGNKKRRRSRKERNADSPLLQKRKNGLNDVKRLVQDPALVLFVLRISVSVEYSYFLLCTGTCNLSNAH